MDNDISPITLFHASAGSGKTYQLSLKYLTLVKHYSSPNDQEALRKILAITFTNKAAYEMKERIISFLKEIALETEKGKDLSKNTGIGPNEAETLLENIFLNYDYLEVKTIDSFLFKLFRGLAFELNLTPEFSISRNLKENHIEKALLNVFERANEDNKVSQLLEQFLNFLITHESELTLNIKKKITSELKKFVELSTYKGEVIASYNQKTQFKDTSEINDKTLLWGCIYYNFLTLLKEELEETLFQEKTLYMGIWKEKLAKALSDDFLPWIYLKLGELKAFIIDEFQDTDRLQWLSVYPLVENLISERKIFIAAGDTKQTIYRWRGGDPGLIKLLKENYRDYGLKEISLKHNYRSSPSIVEFNNHFFNLIKNEYELKKELLERVILGKNFKDEASELTERAIKEFDEIFSEVEQKPSKETSGKVFIKWINFEQNTSQKDVMVCLLQKIEGILKELKDSSLLEDTAILFKENEDVSEAASYLISKGFRVIASSFLNLKESSLVNSLISFLSLLFNPEDDVALSAILFKFFEKRGQPILKEYQNFKIKSNNTLTLSEYLKLHQKDLYESHILKPLEKGYYMNLYQFLKFLVSNFRLEESFPEEKPYLTKLFTLALDFTARGGDTKEFLKEWNALSEEEIDLSLEEAPLKILTIHASKGLEFKNVLIPLNFSLKSYTSELQLYFTEKGVHRGKKEEFSEDLLKIYYFEKIKHSLEIFNLLYVAFTRAKENLYILVPTGLKRNFLSAEIFTQIFEILQKKNINLSEKVFFQE